jgi:hypothetical protein
VYGWLAIGVQLNSQSERTGRENSWYSLTGRVVAVKVETDGDLHLALQDATDEKPGVVRHAIIVREILGPPRALRELDVRLQPSSYGRRDVSVLSRS